MKCKCESFGRLCGFCATGVDEFPIGSVVCQPFTGRRLGAVLALDRSGCLALVAQDVGPLSGRVSWWAFGNVALVESVPCDGCGLARAVVS